jgi:hypothetical protein
MNVLRFGFGDRRKTGCSPRIVKRALSFAGHFEYVLRRAVESISFEASPRETGGFRTSRRRLSLRSWLHNRARESSTPVRRLAERASPQL